MSASSIGMEREKESCLDLAWGIWADAQRLGSTEFRFRKLVVPHKLIQGITGDAEEHPVRMLFTNMRSLWGPKCSILGTCLGGR